MKVKLLSLVVACTLIFSCGTTYTSTTSNAAYGLPENIRTSFTALYPDATNVTYTQFDAATAPVDWELNGWTALDTKDYVVSFDMGGRKYYTWYDSDGSWIGTSTAVNYTQLPSAVSNLLQNNYSAFTIESVQKESWKGGDAYEIKLKGTDESKTKILVDTKGNILKEKAKE